MAQVPRIRPTGNQLSVQPAADKVSVEAVSTPGRMLFQLGQGMEDIAGQLAKAQDTAERVKAQNSYEVEVSKIQAEAQNDQDTSAERFIQYQSRIKEAANNSSAKISIPGSRGLFISEAEKSNALASHKIADVFRAKQKDERLAEFAMHEDLLKNSYITATTREVKDAVTLKRDSYLINLVNGLHLSKEDAVKKRIAFEKEWNDAHIRYMSDSNPEYALEQLKASENGLFSSATPEQRQKGIRQAEIAIKRNATSSKTQDRIVKTVNNDEVVKLAHFRQIEPWQVEERYVQGKIDESTYKSVMKSMTDREDDNGNIIASVDSEPQAYFEFLNFARDPKNSIDEINNKLLEMKGAGSLGIADSQNFAKMAVIQSGNDWVSLSSKDPSLENRLTVEKQMAVEKEEHKGFMQSSLDTLWGSIQGIHKARGEAFSGAADEVFTTKVFGPAGFGTEIVSRFLGKISNGAKPSEWPSLAAEAVKEQATKNPRNAQYKVGDKIYKGGAYWEVTGYDVDGEPFVKVIK